jgi:hypothetical protein
MTIAQVTGEGRTAAIAEQDAKDKAELKANDEALEDFKKPKCPKKCPDQDSTIDKLKVTSKVFPRRTRQIRNIHVHVHVHVHIPPTASLPAGYNYDYDLDLDDDWFTAEAIATWSYKVRCGGGKTIPPLE